MVAVGLGSKRLRAIRTTGGRRDCAGLWTFLDKIAGLTALGRGWVDFALGLASPLVSRRLEPLYHRAEIPGWPESQMVQRFPLLWLVAVVGARA